MPNLEELRKKRDQLSERIKAAESRKSQEDRKAETKIKILIGTAVLSQVKRGGGLKNSGVIEMMNSYLSRAADIKTVLGENRTGSEILKKLTTPATE
jgi:hypothetical protein